jgi:acetyl esterase/lipase
LNGFPPTLIQVGSDETLVDDAFCFTSAAGAADVAVTLAVWLHMIHAWPLWNVHLEAGAAHSPAPDRSCAIICEAPVLLLRYQLPQDRRSNRLLRRLSRACRHPLESHVAPFSAGFVTRRYRS